MLEPIWKLFGRFPLGLEKISNMSSSEVQCRLSGAERGLEDCLQSSAHFSGRVTFHLHFGLALQIYSQEGTFQKSYDLKIM